MKKFFILVFMGACALEGQTDSLDFLDYFPMHIGDRWQYEISEKLKGITGYVTITVTGDSLAPNGKRYFAFSDAGLYRMDTSAAIAYQYYPGIDGSCIHDEWEMIDFSGIDSADWCWSDCLHGRSCASHRTPLYFPSMRDSFSTLQVYHEYVGITWSYSYDLGLTKVVYEPSDYIVWEIIAAEIDGMLYGEFLEIGGNDHIAKPSLFWLSAPYPNPFNPVSTIRYDLPQASEVSLVVYDILGREVARLVDGYMEPGYHQVVWDGRAATGREVPSGVYIARLVTPEYSKSIKMMLLK